MKKIVVIGGGTGNFTVLSGLKRYPVDLSAIVSMADDGGSTGVLRDELGVLPPGDVRQCLVALSDSSRLMRSLVDYRFDQGGLSGHSLGNLILSALEKLTGSFESAVREVSRILAIRGTVIPVTTHHVRLKMLLANSKLLHGEKEIYLSDEIERVGFQDIYLDPFPKVNPRAITAIENADFIVLGPGGLYTSIIPNLLVEGVVESLQSCKAKIVFVCNLMNRKGQTTGYTVQSYLDVIRQYISQDIFDMILVNKQNPDRSLMQKYASQGELVVNDIKNDSRLVSADLLGDVATVKPGDRMPRNLIRHHSGYLAREIMNFVNNF